MHSSCQMASPCAGRNCQVWWRKVSPWLCQLRAPANNLWVNPTCLHTWKLQYDLCNPLSWVLGKNLNIDLVEVGTEMVGSRSIVFRDKDISLAPFTTARLNYPISQHVLHFFLRNCNFIGLLINTVWVLFERCGTHHIDIVVSRVRTLGGMYRQSDLVNLETNLQY